MVEGPPAVSDDPDRSSEDMTCEIEAAVSFILTSLKNRKALHDDAAEKLRTALVICLKERFEGHWYPNCPFKGSGYRCINVDKVSIDPVLVRAAKACRVEPAIFSEAFAEGLAIWIDPYDVCYRLGFGAVRPIYDGNPITYTSIDAVVETSDPGQYMFGMYWPEMGDENFSSLLPEYGDAFVSRYVNQGNDHDWMFTCTNGLPGTTNTVVDLVESDYDSSSS